MFQNIRPAPIHVELGQWSGCNRSKGAWYYPTQDSRPLRSTSAVLVDPGRSLNCDLNGYRWR